MNKALKCLAAAIMLGVPLSAEAHRVWMLPSATVLSGDNVWVTIDAAVSNDLFYFEHFPLRIANVGSAPASLGGRGRPGQLAIVAPDGSKPEAQNGAIGRYRSTFDVHLDKRGTYRIAVVNDGAVARYKEGGQNKRWSGTPEEFAAQVPAQADGLQASYNQSRVEVFVTSGKPTTDALKPVGTGLELAPVTHPNDLVAGTPARFTLLLDGKPAPNVGVTVIPGGNRYRDKLGEMKLTTDTSGAVAVTWPEPGMYWLEATVRDDKGPTPALKQRRAAYVATLEVLPP